MDVGSSGREGAPEKISALQPDVLSRVTMCLGSTALPLWRLSAKHIGSARIGPEIFNNADTVIKSGAKGLMQ